MPRLSASPACGTAAEASARRTRSRGLAAAGWERARTASDDAASAIAGTDRTSAVPATTTAQRRRAPAETTLDEPNTLATVRAVRGASLVR